MAKKKHSKEVRERAYRIIEARLKKQIERLKREDEKLQREIDAEPSDLYSALLAFLLLIAALGLVAWAVTYW